jgi:hypothetical protein
MELHVECYAGYKGDQRPRLFIMDGRKFEVRVLLDTWYGPDDEYFRVLADDGNMYILRHRHTESADSWSLEAFRRTDPSSPGSDPGAQV